jgi:hypothetical protein
VLIAAGGIHRLRRRAGSVRGDSVDACPVGEYAAWGAALLVSLVALIGGGLLAMSGVKCLEKD